MPKNPKDKLYYDDLIYELKKICGELSSNEKNQETEERIERRENDIIILDSKGTGPFKKDFRMSLFNTDVFLYLRKIKYLVYKNPKIKYYYATTNIERFHNITQDPNYKETFNIVIQELEEKKRNAEQQKSSPKRRTKKKPQ